MSGERPKGPVGTRKEVGDSASSRRHPPHVDENVEDAPIQERNPSGEKVAPLPANAHGTDKPDPHDQQEEAAVEEESMYEHRRDEDKDRPPSTR